jgi:hypothetical protein
MLVKFFDTSVHIKNIQFGVVVQGTKFVDGGGREKEFWFGHVVGFSRNITNELTIVVRVNSQDHEFHPANLIFNIQ